MGWEQNGHDLSSDLDLGRFEYVVFVTITIKEERVFISVLFVPVAGIGVIVEFTRANDETVFSVQTKAWITCVYSFTIA